MDFRLTTLKNTRHNTTYAVGERAPNTRNSVRNEAVRSLNKKSSSCMFSSVEGAGTWYWYEHQVQEGNALPQHLCTRTLLLPTSGTRYRYRFEGGNMWRYETRAHEVQPTGVRYDSGINLKRGISRQGPCIPPDVYQVCIIRYSRCTWAHTPST